MRPSCRLVAVVVIPVTAMLTVSCSRNQEKPAEQVKTTLEFRRAESEPGEGLTEASVPGWEERIYLHPTADVTAADVSEARVVTESREPNPVVELVFTTDGSRKMATLTDEHRGKRFAILLDGRVVSAPAVLARVSGRVQITGAFTRADADRLVKSINAK